MKRVVSLANIYGFVAIFSSIYGMISYFQTGVVMGPYVIPWFLALVIIFSVDRRILRNGVTVEHFMMWNFIAFIIYVLVSEIWLSNLYGIMARVFAIIVIGITAVMAMEQARAGTQTNQIVLQMEITVVLLGFVLFFEETKVVVDSSAKIYLMLAVIMDLFALICSRTGVGQEDVRRKEQKWKGFLLLALVTGILLLAGVLFVMACSGRGREVLQILINHGVGILLVCIVKASNLFICLFQKLPGYDGGGSSILPEPVDIASQAEMQPELDAPHMVVFMIGLMMVLAVIAIIIYIIKRFARVKMKTIHIEQSNHEQRRIKTSWGLVIKRLIKMIYNKMIFRWKILTHPHSPEAKLWKAENLGRRYHLPRKITESPGVYLRRLANDERIIGRGLAEELFLQAEEIERHFYRQEAKGIAKS